ncbi:hypothetical protein M9Y10_038691 [Tritrichomonas musculus]|uniref:Uncharacterized protein n=1 Tax=Tritrichomonas musculus TaxID=1915356 RepID=A0ABR2K9U6_9EUKA
MRQFSGRKPVKKTDDKTKDGKTKDGKTKDDKTKNENTKNENAKNNTTKSKKVDSSGKLLNINTKALVDLFSADVLKYDENNNDDNNNDDENRYDIFMTLDADLPSTLNSLIAIGIYFINAKFIISENDLSDQSSSLSNHPNFCFNILQDAMNLMMSDRFIHNTIDFVKLLQRKFLKYIFFDFFGQSKKNINISQHLTYLYPLYIPKKEDIICIEPEYDYVILPCDSDVLQKAGDSKLESFLDSFQYCCKLQDLYKKPSEKYKDDYVNYICKYTMKYQLRWIITTDSSTQLDCSIPLLNSQLFIRLSKNSFLKISNNLASIVPVYDIFNYYFRYFCYEKLPLNLHKDYVRSLVFKDAK